MKNSVYDEVYNLHKEMKIRGVYVDLLCEILLLHYEFSHKNITKKSVLSELPGLREFKSTEVDKIYMNAIELLRIKYDIEVIEENPFKFKDNRKEEY